MTGTFRYHHGYVASKNISRNRPPLQLQYIKTNHFKLTSSLKLGGVVAFFSYCCKKMNPLSKLCSAALIVKRRVCLEFWGGSKNKAEGVGPPKLQQLFEKMIVFAISDWNRKQAFGFVAFPLWPCFSRYRRLVKKPKTFCFFNLLVKRSKRKD